MQRNSGCSVSPEATVSPVLPSSWVLKQIHRLSVPCKALKEKSSCAEAKGKPLLDSTGARTSCPHLGLQNSPEKGRTMKKEALPMVSCSPQRFPQPFYCLEEEEREPWREELAKVFNILHLAWSSRFPKIFKNNCRDVYPRPRAKGRLRRGFQGEAAQGREHQHVDWAWSWGGCSWGPGGFLLQPPFGMGGPGSDPVAAAVGLREGS